MSFISVKHGAAACAFATLAMIGVDAAAATVRITCEVRPGRSKISVDGKDLVRGQYATSVVSGSHMAASPLRSSDGDEVEVDYDSNPGDIGEGAVAISSTFIVGGSVTGKILDAKGNTVIADTVACRVRRK